MWNFCAQTNMRLTLETLGNSGKKTIVYGSVTSVLLQKIIIFRSRSNTWPRQQLQQELLRGPHRFRPPNGELKHSEGVINFIN